MTNDEIRRFRKLQETLDRLSRDSKGKAEGCRQVGLCVMQDYHEGMAKGFETAADDLRELLDELTLAK